MKKIRLKLSLRGFTLIEVLLGLSIFSLVALTVYSVFWSGIRLSKRSKGMKNPYLEMTMSLDLLARELQQMAFFDFSGSYSDKTAFEGKEQNIRFILPTKDGLKIIRYYLTSMYDSKVHKILLEGRYSKNVDIKNTSSELVELKYLIREEQDFISFLNSSGGKEPNREVICMNVKDGSLKFSYGEIKGELEKTIEWKSSWEKETMPSAVKIEFQTIAGDKKKETFTLKRNILIPTSI